ncbi:MAG: hypothetical protein IPM98_16950 [Lewinellaceae bacterium]|nr:hypothetical protein [Lewinellaceae bacterium]
MRDERPFSKVLRPVVFPGKPFFKRYIFLFCIALGFFSPTLRAQILYGITYGGNLVRIDPNTCEICPIGTLQGAGGNLNDIVVLPDGNILGMAGGGGTGLYLYEPGNPGPVWASPVRTLGGVLAPNGLVYLSTLDPNIGLSVFDPATNTVTFLGPWPAGVGVTELFFENGILYGVGFNNGPPVTAQIIQINIADPSQSVIVIQNVPMNIAGGGLTNGVYNTNNINLKTLSQYDPATNTNTVLCDFSDMNLYPFLNQGIRGLTDLPPGVDPLPCPCETDAGTISNWLQTICIPNDALVFHNGDEFLESDDLLQYILFTDLTDTLGSIVATSNTPVFLYDPVIMQPGVTYYVAAIAGNDLNGNVDLDDPCLHISNTAQVIWTGPPAVTFTAGNPDLCIGGCLTLNVALTGVAPFSLNGNLISSGVVIGTFSENYNANTGTLVVCAPPGTPLGAIQVQATALTDAACTCD